MDFFFGGADSESATETESESASESEEEYDLCSRGGSCSRKFGGNCGSNGSCGRGGNGTGGCGSGGGFGKKKKSCISGGGGSSAYGGQRQVSVDNTVALPFDPSCLEKVILAISDRFDFRVVLSDSRTAGAFLVTAGLAVAGSLIGHRCGGKVGAAVGGAVGGACGVGIVVLSMRDVWEEIKTKLWDLYDMVYDYLAGLGIEDYKTAATFLAKNSTHSTQLAMMMMNVGSELLGKKILSSLTAT